MQNQERNQNPEQIARDRIDAMLVESGWAVQNRTDLNWQASRGLAVREYPTDSGPADYVLFVDRQAVGVIEAKKETEGHKLSMVEGQSDGYASAKLKWISNQKPLRFVFESTGILTRFHDLADPRPRSREIFSFFRPETLAGWLGQDRTLRDRLQKFPPLCPNGLRDCQTQAILNLEKSFGDNRPRALIQMATGAGKTYTAITNTYRLLKYAKAKRVLFLVDTRNLGEQAEQEFRAYVPIDDNRTFPELYNIQRLTSNAIASTSQVVVCTIQRLYSILKGLPFDDADEIDSPAEKPQPKKPMPVVYSSYLPPEFFDFIVVDECHRSIYNVWQQVLDYFDAFQVGLTATPDNRTFAYFNENVVSEYSQEDAVADGVNVGHDVYLIETEITRNGAVLPARQLIERRERLTRRRRWQMQDEDETYSAKELDRDVVNPSQIRTVIRSFRDQLPVIFPGRREVPKTLIFAKTDSHADDIIATVREEFAQGNEFCKKVTYQAEENTRALLAQFRNAYYPRIAVTVDMIATGTDVKPLECLLFMRDVRSRNYFEQMKGRGTRSLEYEKLHAVTPSAPTAKTHFVIVDAVGVTRSLKTDSRPLERKPGVSLKELLNQVLMGDRSEDTLLSLGNRLARLGAVLDERERHKIREQSDGFDLTEITAGLLRSQDPDRIEARARTDAGLADDAEPSEEQLQAARLKLGDEAAAIFNGRLCKLIEEIRRCHEQTLDTCNLDSLRNSGWAGESDENARALTGEFADWLREKRDEITALGIYFALPFRRREVSARMIRDLCETLRRERPKLAPLRVWQAYAHLDKVTGQSLQSELTALVSLLRRVCGPDETITPFAEAVERNFKAWIFNRHAGAGTKFNELQMDWLRLIRDHVAASIRLEREDLELAPFNARGGLGRMWQLFGDQMDPLIEEINEALVG